MIAGIEAGMVERVAKASSGGVLPYTLKQVESYAGQLDDLSQVIRKLPAVWFAFAGKRRPERFGGLVWRHFPTFSAFVATRSSRNEAAARHGGPNAPGSYQILMDIRALLVGQDLGLAIDAIAPGPVQNVLQEKGVSIYAHELTTVYESEGRPPAGLDDFKHFHADFDLPPHGNVTPPLPAAEADASDDVTMETT